MKPSQLHLGSRRRLALVAMLISACSAATAQITSIPLAPSEPLPTEWKQWNGHYYRLEADGHLSCYSDGSWPVRCTPAFPDPAKQRPLSCKSLQWHNAEKRSVTGYQSPGHWCGTAFANLFAKWVDHSPVGHPFFLATTPGGDTLCSSPDGVTCESVDGPQPPSPSGAGSIQPVVCGPTLRQRSGVSGYEKEQASHWCQSPEVLAVASNIKPFYGATLALRTWREDDRVTVTIQVDSGHVHGTSIEVLSVHATRKNEAFGIGGAYQPPPFERLECADGPCRSEQSSPRHTLVLRFRGAYKDVQELYAPGWHVPDKLDAVIRPVPRWAVNRPANPSGGPYDESMVTVEPALPHPLRDGIYDRYTKSDHFKLHTIVVSRDRRLPADQ